MTITLFMALIVVFAMAVSLLTEAIKKFFEGSKVTYSSNVIVLIVSIIVGIGGTAMAYIALGIAFTPPNVIAMVLMAVAVWVGAMLGYDKVIQMIEQIHNIKK